jgi:predicted metal-dependent phosphoesterase TrpH
MEHSVDYHNHTYYSDGTDSPAKVVKRAKEKGLHTIAITDHDGVDGIGEAMVAGEALDIRVIAGIELSAKGEGGENVHILGYHIDPKEPRLLAAIQEIREKREERNEKLLAALAEEGYPLAMEDLITREGQSFIGKPIFARAMVKKGYIDCPEQAFDEIFSKPALRKIKKMKLPVGEAIDLIKGAGGIPVLAHPMEVDKIGKRGTEKFYENLDLLLGNLRKKGLRGLECFYPDHTEEETMKLIDLAEKYHLHITRGSDYHGD